MNTIKNKIVKVSIFTIFILLFSFKSFGQFDENFKNLYQVADNLTDEDNYRDALPIWLKLDSLCPNNMNIYFNIGLCYLNSSYKSKSIPYFEAASQKASVKYHGMFYDTLAPVYTYFFLGKAYGFENNLAKAEENNSKFKSYLPNKKKKDIVTTIDVEIMKNATAKNFMANPLRIKVDNLGEPVNSIYSDYAPVFFENEGKMFFTSRREGSTGGLPEEEGKYFEDIYSSVYSKATNHWEYLKNVGTPLNTSTHDATIGKTWDEKGLYMYRFVKKRNGNVFTTYLNGDNFTKPESFPKEINKKSMENHACVTKDGNTIYFVSNRKGGLGGKDIWVTHKDAKGKWSKSENMGPNINTKVDEEAPYLMEDGRIFYFCSKGHENMGNYDIFYSSHDEKGWSPAQNLGYPINSTENDIYFTPCKDSVSAYFSSSRYGGIGEMDIYKMTLTQPNSPAFLKCIVLDSLTRTPVFANVNIKNRVSEIYAEQITVNPEKGETFFNIQYGNN
jgi:tetratricopeptide (TPR) repeat protein